MGRLAQYLFILSGVVLLLWLAGYGSGGALLQILLNPTTITTSPLYYWMRIALTSFAAIAGIAVGILYPVRLDQIASATVTSVLFGLIFEIGSITLQLYSISPTLALITCSPLTLLGALTVFEWWRLHD